jgi:hypothetical protein
MRWRQAAVILQRTKHRIGIDLIAGTIETTDATVGVEHAGVVREVVSV